MGKRCQVDNNVSSFRGRCDGCFRFVAALVRKPIFAYVTVALALALSVGIYDHHQRAEIVANDRRAHNELQLHQYSECLNLESVKTQANHRIVLLKKAEQGIVFKTAEVQAQVATTLNAVQPLVKVDCTPLRVGK